MTQRSILTAQGAACAARLAVLVAFGAGFVDSARGAEPSPPTIETQPSTEDETGPSSEPPLAQSAPSAAMDEAPSAPRPASDPQLTLLRQEVRALHQELALLRAQLPPAEPPLKPVHVAPTPLQRGHYYTGGTLSLGYRARDDYETLAGTVDDGRRFTMKVEGIAGYVLQTNLLALGLTVAYQRTLSKGILSDSGADPNDLNSVEYNVRAGPALRGFLPVDEDNRFFVYAQAAVVFGYGERVERSFTETTSSVLSSNGFSMGLAVQPGLMVAANEHFAFEIGVNVLGLEYQDYKATTDHTSEGREQAVEVSVDLNLLSLQFAFVGYF